MKRKLLVLLKSKGVENTLIQELTGYHPKSINSLYKKWKDRDTYLDAERSGRPPKLDDDQTKELATILDDSRESSAASVKAEWGKTCPLPWSTRSIQRFRRKLGYRMKLAKQKPVLSEANKLKRLEYARKHHKAKWGRHIFIDESDFHLYPRKKFFWLRRRERKFFHRPAHSPALKVICGISIHGQVFLRTYSGTINSAKFKSILGKVKRLINAHFTNPIVVMDNATPHKSQETTKWLTKHFQTLPLPPQSPDLNPIETVFAYVKKRVQDQGPKNMKTLDYLIKNSWRTMSKDFIQKTIRHTSLICEQIINDHGSNEFK